MKRLYSMFLVSALASTALACAEPLLMTRDGSGDRWSAPGNWEPVESDDALLATRHVEADSSAVVRTLPSRMETHVARAWVLAAADSAWPDARLLFSTDSFDQPSGERVTQVSVETGGTPRYLHDFYLFPQSTRYIEVVTAFDEYESTREDRSALVRGFTPGAELVTRRSEDTARVGALAEVGLQLPLESTPPLLKRSLVATKDDKSVTLSAPSRLITGRIISYELPYPTTVADLAKGLLTQARSRGEKTEPVDAWAAALVARESPSLLSPMTHVHAIHADGIRVYQLTLSTPTTLEGENLEPMLELIRGLVPVAP